MIQLGVGCFKAELFAPYKVCGAASWPEISRDFAQAMATGSNMDSKLKHPLILWLLGPHPRSEAGPRPRLLRRALNVIFCNTKRSTDSPPKALDWPKPINEQLSGAS
jgi:hypothetical protein